MKIKLGVIYGGETVEHEVSIITAVQAMHNINQDKYDIIPIYISKDRNWYSGKVLMDIEMYQDFDNLKKYVKRVTMYKKDGIVYLQSLGLFKSIITELDLVFPIVHGNNVEDGSIQGYLDTIGVPYVGSGILGSAIGQDKVVQKQLLENNGVSVVPYTWFYEETYYSDKDKIIADVKKISYPVIIKPANLGSSIGITVVKNEDKLEDAILSALKYDNKILIEKVIDNLVEINCSVLGDYTYQQVSVLEEVLSTEEFLTYKDKYVGNTKGNKSKGMLATDRIIPARVDEKIEKQIKELAIKTFLTLNLSGVPRIDFLYDKKSKKVYVNEANTIPGSLSFYLWEPIGKKYSDLLEELITLTIKDYKKRSKKVCSFENNILNNIGGLKGGKGLKGLKGKLK